MPCRPKRRAGFSARRWWFDRGRPARTELGQAATLPVRWKIVAGLKVIAEGETGDRIIAWPDDLPGGSYRLHLTEPRRSTEEVPLIVAPPRAYGGDFDRCWLLAVQLYGVRSARNWGIGDFTDLEGADRTGGQFGSRWGRPQSAARAVR